MPNINYSTIEFKGSPAAIQEIWQKGTKTARDSKQILNEIQNQKITEFSELEKLINSSSNPAIKDLIKNKQSNDWFNQLSSEKKIKEIKNTLEFWSEIFVISDVINKDQLTTKQLKEIKTMIQENTSMSEEQIEQEISNWLNGKYSYEVASIFIGTKWDGINWENLDEYEPENGDSMFSIFGQTAWSPISRQSLELIQQQYKLKCVEQRYESTENDCIGLTYIDDKTSTDLFLDGSWETEEYKDYLNSLASFYNDADAKEQLKLLNEVSDDKEKQNQIEEYYYNNYMDFCEYIWADCKSRAQQGIYNSSIKQKTR